MVAPGLPWFQAMFAGLTASDHQISDTLSENSSISSSDLTIDEWNGYDGYDVNNKASRIIYNIYNAMQSSLCKRERV